MSEFFKQAREKQEMSQAELGRRLGYTTGQFVSNWERQKSNPPDHQLKKLCTILLIHRHDLIVELTERRKNELKKVLS